MDFIKYKKQIIISAIIIVALVAMWSIYYYFFTFSVLSTSPSRDRVATASPIITLTTNRTISDAAISFDDGSSGIVASVKPFKNTVIINLYQNMEADKKYTIKISDLMSKDGYKMASYTFIFTPKLDASLVNDAGQQIILDRQDNKPAIIDDPLISATPFSSDSYVVKSSLNSTPDGKGAVGLNATIFLTREDVVSGYDAAVEKYKAEIQDQLLKIQGYDAAKYQITYKIQDP